MAQYKTRRQNRYNRLTSEWFTRAEAQALSGFKFNLPYIQAIRQDRAELVRDARQLDLPRRKALATLRSWIDRIYTINDWKDAYAMMRDYRQRGIDRGEYVPPPPRPRKPATKGDVLAQKRRYRDKQRTRPAPVGEVVFNEKTGRYEAVIYPR